MAVQGRQGRDGGAAKKRIKALAEFILHDGPQPPEALLSVICEAFNCTPAEALEQDPQTVYPILEYRLAEAAKRQHKTDVSKMTEGMARLWKEMHKALKDQ
jgi:hypothetical protein